LPQLPQLLVLEATQEPLQERSPPEQAQAPLVQVLPLPQALPQLPQFWLSVCRLTQAVPHCICPELQDGPVPPVPVLPVPPAPPVPSPPEGLAHPEASRVAPKRAIQAKKAVVRESILNSLWGAERTKRRP
jgi:hypothetical protein